MAILRMVERAVCHETRTKRKSLLPSTPALVPNWSRSGVRIHGRKPPKCIKRGLIERAHSWHMQAKVYGGLKPEIRRYLLQVAEANTAKVVGADDQCTAAYMMVSSSALCPSNSSTIRPCLHTRIRSESCRISGR